MIMRYTWILTGLCFLLVTLMYACRLRHNTINAAIKEAVTKSDYKLADIRVYDSVSSESHCHRLISIEPFQWLIWCFGAQTYVVSEEGASKCANDKCPALQLNSDGTMTEKCLSVSRDTLESFYMSGDIIPVSIPYSISRKSKTFTIHHALDILLDRKLLKV